MGAWFVAMRVKRARSEELSPQAAMYCILLDRLCLSGPLRPLKRGKDLPQYFGFLDVSSQSWFSVLLVTYKRVAAVIMGGSASFLILVLRALRWAVIAALEGYDFG